MTRESDAALAAYLASLAGLADDGTPKKLRLDTGTHREPKMTITVALEAPGGERITVGDVRNWLARLDAELEHASREQSGAAGAAPVIVTRAYPVPYLAALLPGASRPQTSPRGAITRIEAEIPDV